MPKPATVSIEVTGEPRRALILLESAALKRSARTDAAGRGSVSLPAGRYKIAVTRQGKKTTRGNVAFGEGPNRLVVGTGW